MRSRLQGFPAFWEKPRVTATLSFIFGLSLFTIILLNRSPNLLRPISLNIRTGFNLTVAIFFVLIYISFRLRGWLGQLLSLTFTLALFAFALAGLWAIGGTQPTVLSGVIPLFDASDYYNDALRLLSGQDFSVFSARRPLFAGLFSVVLWAVQNNLLAAVSVFTLISALACYIAAREIQRTSGSEVAVFVLAILFLFYRIHSGLVMSENLGLPLGTLGFALLWRGTADRKYSLMWFGFFVTTLALNARAGAFFVLPVLLLWGGWIFRKQDSKFSFQFFGLGSSAVIAGFVINLIMVNLLATPSGVPFANFSYTLYGLASGGKSWVYVFESHPELYALQEPSQSREIYRMAFDLIKSNPILLIKGALFNWSMLFSNTWYSAYSFVGGENQFVQKIVQWGLFILSALGFWRWFRKLDDSFSGLVGSAAIGVLLSVPFLPPTDAYRMRPYAASMIVFGLLPAMGLLFGMETLKLRLPKPADENNGKSMAAPLSILLILVMIIAPVAIKNLANMPKFEKVSCDSDLSLVSLRFDPGTSVSIIRQNEPGLDWMPVFHVARFKRNAHSLPNPDLIAWAEGIEPSTSLFSTLDYDSMHSVLVVTPTNWLPEPGTLWQICGTWEENPYLMRHNVFKVRAVAELP